MLNYAGKAGEGGDHR